MKLVFGFDIGTTSIGFAAVKLAADASEGDVVRLGARIFPEARDRRHSPLNQTRRQKRLTRRQTRRRRQRRRLLNETLYNLGLLPSYGSNEWLDLMAQDPYTLRERGLTDRLDPHEFGRAIYHLAKRRHFKGRDLAEATAEDHDFESEEEKEQASDRENTIKALRRSGMTLGAWLNQQDASKRKRCVHAHRDAVHDEYERLWTAQAAHIDILKDQAAKESMSNAIFFQRPTFWRRSTLGRCRLRPDSPLAARGSWISEQRRMLETLNNLAISGGNSRSLDKEERAAIISVLQTKDRMTWGEVRKAIEPVFKARGESTRQVRFNLEDGGERQLRGNSVEKQLAQIFGLAWKHHPHRVVLRREVHRRLWAADYGQVGDRIVIRPREERQQERNRVIESFVSDFGLSHEEAEGLRQMKFAAGWDAFSEQALESILPKLEEGHRLGSLLVSPDYEEWRDKVFPTRERPTGEVHDKLPSPSSPEEAERLKGIRNPTVVRAQNELRKVVNNLIHDCGRKPDLIRIELARDVGQSKKQREERQSAIKRRERQRDRGTQELLHNGLQHPSRDDVDRWILWQECGCIDPYSGETISFDDLFRNNVFQIEHIWPRSQSLNDSLANKTLCHREWNAWKSNKTPFEAFGDLDVWSVMKERIWQLVRDRKLTKGKAKRFCREEPLPDDFATRQLNDTGYAARQAVAMLQRLWPDVGMSDSVRVQAVTGRVTSHLRRHWGLNKVLADDGEKTRADHRHHAIDALVVACCGPDATNRLSRYWQKKEVSRATEPQLSPPWPSIRQDVSDAISDIVVSHRVIRKISGQIHKETIYGDTGVDRNHKSQRYREIVFRKSVDTLSRKEMDQIRDPVVRDRLKKWVLERGGDPKKAFGSGYPSVSDGGPEIRSVRLTMLQQLSLLAAVNNGFADLANNHHVAVWQRCDEPSVFFEVASLFEVMRRKSKSEKLVHRTHASGKFLFSLCQGDTIEWVRGGEPGFWVVSSIWSSGQIVVQRIEDATGASVTRPKISTLVKDGCRKLSVDPIGRVRVARD